MGKHLPEREARPAERHRAKRGRALVATGRAGEGRNPPWLPWPKEVEAKWATHSTEIRLRKERKT